MSIWDFMPLGLVKFVAKRWGAKPTQINIGLDGIGPFYVRALGGVLVRVPTKDKL